MNKAWFLAGLLLLLLSGVSCRTTRQATATATSPVSAAELWQALDGSRLQFQTFSARADLDIEDASGKSSATAVLRMHRDSLIWVSLRKAGLEGARLLITRDSLHILDRTGKAYYPLAFAGLRTQYGVDLSFAALQDLIAGNALVREPLDWSAGIDDGKLLLSGEDGGRAYRFWQRPSDLKLAALSLQELSAHPGQQPGHTPLPGSSQALGLTMKLEGYEPLDDQVFAAFRLLTLQGQNPASLQVHFSKMALNEPELSFSFTVNPGYTTVRDPK